MAIGATTTSRLKTSSPASVTTGATGWDPPNRQVVGYTLQITDHWILSDVGDGVLGDVYHDNGEPAGLIGYERDGTPAQSKSGILVPSGTAPTPPDFLILGQAQFDGNWQDDGHGHGVNVCTMGLYTNHGVSFTVGTVDWGRVLASGREPRVETLTRNVLDRLSVREPEGWATFGGQITSSAALALNLDGRLELYARGYDGVARHVWQNAPNRGWASWASEGATLAGDGTTETWLSMARNKDGRLQLFARFSDGSIRCLLQNAPNYTWAPWVSLGGNVAGDPVAARSRVGGVHDGCLWASLARPAAASGGGARPIALFELSVRFVHHISGKTKTRSDFDYEPLHRLGAGQAHVCRPRFRNIRATPGGSSLTKDPRR